MPNPMHGKDEKVMIGVIVIVGILVLLVFCIPISMLIRHGMGSDTDDKKFSDLFVSVTYWITFVVMVVIVVIAGVVHEKYIQNR